MLESFTHLADTHKQSVLRDLLPQDSNRHLLMTHSLEGLTVDFCKHLCLSSVLEDMCKYADTLKIRDKIKQLFQGAEVNNTEKRAATHTGLRDSNHSKAVSDILGKMAAFTHTIHHRQHTGLTGKPIDTIVNIGIGGSDLGPKMICEALAPFKLPGINTHFVSNIDGWDLHNTLQRVNPETTLFVLASKSFGTQETKMNAESARQWFLSRTGCKHEDLAKHFIAITSAVEKASDFGIATDNCFPMSDSVGGRYSLWSAIGLPIALTVGMHHFKGLLQGAHCMDQHYLRAPFDQNIPFLMAFFSTWYQTFFDAHTHAVLPYDQRLALLPSYLQQLDMESLGKSVQRDGSPVTSPTGQIIWGNTGTNGQHAFHQLLHQGTAFVPLDFILVKKPHHPFQEHHDALAAHCFAQSEAFMYGLTEEAAYQSNLDKGLDEVQARFLAKHQAIEGNKPSTTFMMESLTPFHLGQLIAAYEHKVYTQSLLYNINAFDQWGVELGKALSKPILECIRTQMGKIRPETEAMIKQYKS